MPLHVFRERTVPHVNNICRDGFLGSSGSSEELSSGLSSDGDSSSSGEEQVRWIPDNGAIQCYVILFPWKFDPHPHNANNLCNALFLEN